MLNEKAQAIRKHKEFSFALGQLLGDICAAPEAGRDPSGLSVWGNWSVWWEDIPLQCNCLS